MINQLVALIIDESKWLTASMGAALIAVIWLLYLHRNSRISARRRILAAMNLFFGVTIGTMALGHLLAVTTKLAMTILQGQVFVFYLIGIALAVPSCWLVLHTLKILKDSQHERATLVLNLWLAVTLLAMGPHNLPLAAPAFFNIGYQLNSRRILGWVIASMAIVVNLGLFIGSLVFFASGQSFEQFRGID